MDLALKHPVLLGNPTFQNLLPVVTKSLCNGILFQTYQGDSLERGIQSAELVEGRPVLIGYDGKPEIVKANWDCK